jgi:hypothetical protein
MGLLVLMPGLVIAALVGLRPGIVEMKTVPNQGLAFSIRSTLFGGFAGGLITGLPFGVIPGMVVGLVSGLQVGLGVGLGVTVLAGILAGFWFGGLDVIQHYVLRLILVIGGRTPLNYVRFLDYAANELNFLQKVGGGYIFIHRILLEHFAAMEDAEKPNPQDTPALAASTPFEPVSAR